MIRNWVLYALFRVAEQGAREEGIRALKGCDPLVKPWAKQRLVVSLRRAESESGSDDAAHLARLASYLVVGETYEASFDDMAGLKKEYEARFGKPEKPKTGPRLLVGSTTLLLLVAMGATVLHFQFRAFEPSQMKVGALMEQPFTALAVGAANGVPAGIDSALAAFRSESAFPAQKEIEALAAAARKVRGHPEERNRYRTAVLELNKAFEVRSEPYYVDADLYPFSGVLSPVLMSFFIQERGTYSFGPKPIPVLRLWRLDKMNVAQSKLGYTRSASPHAIVLLDHIEHDLVTQILPAVPEGQLMSLTDEDTSLSQEEWVRDVQELGAVIIRKHYASLPPALTEKARRLGQLLAGRRSLLAKWKKNLGIDAHILRMPRRLIPEADYSAELHLRVSASDRVDWDNLHDDLLSDASIRDFEELREAYIQSVERHEVQHRLDYEKERFAIPELLAYRLGGIDRMGHDVHSHPMSSSMELSAYLSQMADDPAPRLALMTMGRIFLNKYSMGTSHGYAGVVALEATAKHLGIGQDAMLGRVATRQELARLLIAVCEKPMSEVKRAAREGYEELFEESLPEVARGKFKKAASWRH